MGLRERLNQRGRAETTFDLRIDDTTDARAELAEAYAGLDGDDPGTQQRLDTARRAVADCYETLRIVAVEPKKWDEMVAAHPSESDAAQPDLGTFGPALLAASVDSDITEQEWADYTTAGTLTSGEVEALYGVVIGLNRRVPDGRVPLGSTPTPS